MLSKERNEARFNQHFSQLKLMAGQKTEIDVPQTFRAVPEQTQVNHGRRPRFGGRKILSKCKYTASASERSQLVHAKQVLEQLTPKQHYGLPRRTPSREATHDDFNIKFDDWMVSLEKPGRRVRPQLSRVAKGVTHGASTARAQLQSLPTLDDGASAYRFSNTARALKISRTRKAVQIMEQYPIEPHRPKESGQGLDSAEFSQLQSLPKNGEDSSNFPPSPDGQRLPTDF